MKKISTAEVRKAILAAEQERLKHPAVSRPNAAQRAALNKNRRASEKMLVGALKRAGLDVKKFQALREQRGRELERMSRSTRRTRSSLRRSERARSIRALPRGARRSESSPR